jgi:GT2 family glycosyltransferase
MPFALGAIAIHVVGANMAMRRSAAAQIGPFDDKLGPGSPQLAGDDLDFVYRAYKAGVKILYTPDAVVYHDHGRRTDLDQAKLRRAYAIGTGAFYFKHILRGNADAMRLAYWDVRRLLARTMRGSESAGAPTDNMRHIGYLAQGALRYSWACIRGARR